MRRKKINFENNKMMNALESEKFITNAKLNAAELVKRQLSEFFVARIRKNLLGDAE